jgi:hypothetical protein
MVKRASADKRLSGFLKKMSREGQQALLDYAEFLVQRYPAKQHMPSEPVEVPKQDNESVVMAIRRLTSTYPMLDRSALLHETSTFVTQHIVHGREADEVIDEMEVYFREQYEVFMEKQSK